MFDEPTTKQPAPTQPKPPSPEPPKIPPVQQPSSGPFQDQVEDILASTETIKESPTPTPPTTPTQEEPLPAELDPAAKTPENDLERINQEMAKQGFMPSDQKKSFSVEESLSKNKTLFIAGIAGVVVIVLAVVGWLIYRRYYTDNTTLPPVEQPPVEQPPVEQPPVEQPPVEQPPVEQPPVEQSPVEQPVDVDTDGDGLTDEEELSLGTNPHKIDTDSDGLADYDEIKVFKTDPTHADTDRDGYLDGEEVASGFDPLESGRLPTINKDASQWLSYTNQNLGLTFKYPREFSTPQVEIIENQGLGRKSFKTSLSAQDDMGNPKMVIEINFDSHGPFFPDKFYEIFEDNTNQLSIKKVEDKNQGDTKVQFFVTQPLMASNSHVYQIYFYAQEGYEDYSILFDYILATFKFIK